MEESSSDIAEPGKKVNENSIEIQSHLDPKIKASAAEEETVNIPNKNMPRKGVKRTRKLNKVVDVVRRKMKTRQVEKENKELETDVKDKEPMVHADAEPECANKSVISSAKLAISDRWQTHKIVEKNPQFQLSETHLRPTETESDAKSIEAANKESSKEKYDNIEVHCSTNVKQLICSHCKGCFTEKIDYDQHTCQGKTYICGACHCGFTRLCYLKRHKCKNSTEEDSLAKKRSHNENSSDSAQKDSINKNEYADPKHPDNITLAESKEDAASKQQLRKSTKSLTDGKSLQCPHCPRKYAKQHFLDKHMFVHDEVMPWSCEKCEAQFRSAAKFREHCKTHGISKPFKCAKCEGYFSSMEVLRVHDRTHTNARPFSCDKCGRMFKQSSNLYDHLRKHNNDRSFICGTCGKAFNLKGDLTKHLQLHTGKKPHQCTYCHMSFPRVSNLNRHLNTHTGTRRFSCSQCEKAFSRREKLREHERTHSGERPYVCEICQRSFANSGNFSNHKRMHREPGFKHNSQKRSASRANTVLREEESSNSPFPVINIDENRSSFSVNVDNVPQLATSDRQSEFNGLQQIVYVTFQNPLVYLNRGNQDASVVNVSANAGSEPLVLQLHNISESQDSEFFSPDNNQDSNKPIDADLTTGNSSSGSPEIAGVKMASGEARSTESGFSEKKSQSEAASLKDNSLTTFLTSADYQSSGFEEACASTSDGKVQGTSNRGASSIDYKQLNMAPSLMPGSGSEMYFSSLTFTDLTGNDDFNNQSGFVLAPQEGQEFDTAKVCERLFVTPTKTNKNENVNSNSKSAMICSQVLVTPEHHTLSKNNEKSREELDEERARLKPRALKM